MSATAPDTEARWIGPDPSGIIDLASDLRLSALFAAQHLADAIIDGEDDLIIELEREGYKHTRAESRRVNELYDRLYASDAPGCFAGYLVRS